MSASDQDTATALARDTLSHFWENFEKPQPGQSRFSLMTIVTDGPVAENCWVSNLTRQNGRINGEITTQPALVKNVQLGSRVDVSEPDITDWFYFCGDKMVGNFTTRVMVKAMPPAEAEHYRQMFASLLPLKIRCACGQKIAFEVEPVGNRMPWALKCPVCGVDATAAANALIQQVLGAPPPPPVPLPAPPVVAQTAPPPAPRASPSAAQYRPGTPAPFRSTVPRPAARRDSSWGRTTGYTSGGLAIAVIGIRLLLALARYQANQHEAEKREQEAKQQEQQFENGLQQRIDQRQQQDQQFFNQQQAFQAGQRGNPPAPAPQMAPKFAAGARVQANYRGNWQPATVVQSTALSVTVRFDDPNVWRGTMGLAPQNVRAQ